MDRDSGSNRGRFGEEKSWDLNKDGKFSFNESYNWWKNGNGQSIQVLLNSIDLSGITPREFPNGIESVKAFNLQYKGNLEEGIIYGSVSFRLYGGNKVKAFNDTYDFDMRSWYTSPVRNAETYLGRIIHGKGTPYEIEFIGFGSISPNPSITRYYIRTGGYH